MCGACGQAAGDERVAGPRRRAASAAAVSAMSGLRVQPALGIWTVATPTGLQRVCATVDELADAVTSMAPVSRDEVVSVALHAAASA